MFGVVVSYIDSSRDNEKQRVVDAEVTSKLVLMQNSLSPIDFGRIIWSIDQKYKDANNVDKPEYIQRVKDTLLGLPDAREFSPSDTFHFSLDSSTVTRYSPAKSDDGKPGEIGVLSVQSLNDDVQRWIDVEYSPHQQSDTSVSGDSYIKPEDILEQSATSAATKDGKVTLVNVFRRDSKRQDIPVNEKTDYVVSVVRSNNKEDNLVYASKLLDIKAHEIADISFNFDGTRVLIVKRDYEINDPPVAYLTDLSFSDSDDPVWQLNNNSDTSDCLFWDIPDAKTKLYTAALTDKNPCPAFITNENEMFCPNSDSGTRWEYGPVQFSWITSAKDDIFLLSDGDALFAWNCANHFDKQDTTFTQGHMLSKLAIGRVDSSTISKSGDEVRIAAVVNKQVQCWTMKDNEYIWNTLACLPNVSAQSIALPMGADKLGYLPEVGGIESSFLLQVPFDSGTSTRKPLEDVQGDKLLATSSESLAQYTPEKQMQPKLKSSSDRRKDDLAYPIHFLKLGVEPDKNEVSKWMVDKKPLDIALSADGDIAAVLMENQSRGGNLQISLLQMVDDKENARISNELIDTEIAFGRFDPQLAVSSRNAIPSNMIYSFGDRVFGLTYNSETKTWEKIIPNKGQRGDGSIISGSGISSNGSGVSCLAISENSRYLAAAWGQHARVIDLELVNTESEGVTSRSMQSGDNAFNFTDDASRCAVSNGGISLFGNKKGELMWGREGGDIRTATEEPNSILPAGIEKITTMTIGSANYALILSAWQSWGCVLDDMGGHTISLWHVDTSKQDSRLSELGRGCMPNARIQNTSFVESFSGYKEDKDFLVNIWSEHQLSDSERGRPEIEVSDPVVVLHAASGERAHAEDDKFISKYGFEFSEKDGLKVIKE